MMDENLRIDSNENSKVDDEKVVTLDYTLTVDGEVIDTSKGSEPIEFIQGQGQIVGGLERELYGMEVGESREVRVSPADGYGESDPNAIADVPRSEFPSQIPLEPGVELQLQDKDGNVMEARIVSVGEDGVTLDFNHPLAGKELHFSVKVVDLREATPEEIDHGHVHETGNHTPVDEDE